jgi:hypothetical protein
MVSDIIGVVVDIALCVIYGVWCFWRGVKFGKKRSASVMLKTGIFVEESKSEEA